MCISLTTPSAEGKRGFASNVARIGFDARLYGYRRGGIQTYLTLLVQALAPVLAARGHTLTVYHAPGFPLPLPADSGVQTATLLTPPHHRIEQLTLPLEIRRTRPDLVHSPDFIPTRHSAWKRVITVHDLDFIRQPHRLTTDARRFYGQVTWAVAEADGIIAPSGAIRDDLTALLAVPPERVTVIAEAPASRFSPPLPDATVMELPHGTPTPGSYFLFVGTVEPRKNLDTLLSAYRTYRADTDIPKELVIVGAEGWESARTAQMLERSAGVSWLRDVDDDALVPLYHGALALLLPSWEEGFGLPVLEAMASGTPVAISTARALEEVAGDAALVAPPDDRDAWAMLMRVLADLPEVRADLTRRGFDRAKAFSWERAANETADLYERVLGIQSAQPDTT